MKSKQTSSSSVTWTRAEAVADAMQSLAIESLDPGPRIRRLANSYTREEVTLPELTAAIEKFDKRERQKL